MSKPYRKIVIVGCGILGASHAYELAQVPGLQVTVVEAASAPAMNLGTGASSACIRRCYSTEALTLMADHAVSFLSRLQAEHQHIPLFFQTGCLSVAKNGADFLKNQIKIFNDLGLGCKELSPSEMSSLYPSLSFSPGEAGVLDEESGYASPQLTTDLLVELARVAGATFHFNCEVTALTERNSKISGVVLKDGRTLEADIVILASAIGTRKILSSLDLELPMPTSIRPVFTALLEKSDGDVVPVMADLTNEVYVRQESGGVLIGSLSELDESDVIADPTNDFAINRTRLHDMIERAAHRLPNVNLNPSKVRVVRGLYDVNDTDWMPIQSPLKIEGLFVSFATSGHGFKLAFALSKMLLRQLELAELPHSLNNIDPDLFALVASRIMAGGVLA